MDISKLLRPRAVAVVGASEKSGFGGDTCRNILENQVDTSHVYPVNPKKETVFGKNAIRHWQICRRRLIWLSFVPLRKPLWIS